jgi:erythromycin esterase-like protein
VGRSFATSLVLAAAVIAGGPATSGPPAGPAQTPARQAAPSPAPSRDALDLAPVDGIIGSAPLVALGESSHWDFGVHDVANRLFRYLAEKHGFRVFVLESAWGVDEVSRDFIASGRTDPGPQESFFLNAFGSPATIETIRWIGEWNRAHPSDPVHMAGYQPEQPVMDFRALFALGSRLPEFDATAWIATTAPCKASNPDFKTELDFLAPILKAQRAGKPGFPEADRQACLASIDTLGAWIENHRSALVAASSAGAFREAQAHILSLKTFYGLLMRVADASVDKTLTPEAAQALAGEVYSKGDEVRTAIFDTLRETRYAGKKMLLWMHNWHAARHADELTMTSDDGIPRGTVSMGTRLARAHGRNLVVIGSVVPCARCATKRDDALDGVFRAALGDSPALIDTRTPAPAYRALPLAREGSLIDPLYDAAMLGVVLNRQYDALLYLPGSDTILDRRAKEKK